MNGISLSDCPTFSTRTTSSADFKRAMIPAMVRRFLGIAMGLLFLLSTGTAWAQQDLYVADGGAGNEQIDIWPTTASGNQAPSVILNSSSFANVSSVAVDSSGNIWACDRTNSAIYEFPAGAAGSVAASNSFIGTNTTLNGCHNIKFDANGNLWVANTGNNDLIVFSAAQQSALLGGDGSPGDVAPAVTLTSTPHSAHLGTWHSIRAATSTSRMEGLGTLMYLVLVRLALHRRSFRWDSRGAHNRSQRSND